MSLSLLVKPWPSSSNTRYSTSGGWRGRLRGYRPSPRAATAARGFQSGVINDYVTWLVVGLACLGGAFALNAD
jgi:hypothetical protein